MPAHTIAMTFRNATKGAVRYEEPTGQENPNYLLGTLYIRKAGFRHTKLNAGVEWPDQIQVTIETGQDL